MTNFSPHRGARLMLCKVPQVTVFFWIIKVLCTTVGETAADLLNENLGFGLTWTSVVMSVLLAIVLAVQFRLRQYVAGVYWLTVVLVSVVGTLVSDNLTDNLGVSLEPTTIAFALALAVTFAAWYARERTLSTHSIDPTRREGFYWAAILFTFALGTAAGDLVSERMNLGYPTAAGGFAAAIVLVVLARRALGPVGAVWAAYVLTRPLGASLGDYGSQPRDEGGLGLGTVPMSAVFLVTILALVVYLGVTRRDVERPDFEDYEPADAPSMAGEV